MAAATGVIYIEQYAKWSAIFKLFQDEKMTIPMKLGGYSNPRMQIRDSANSNVVIAAPTIFIFDIDNGWLKALLTAAQTGSISVSGQTYQMVSDYVYDVLMDDPSGEPIRLFNGYAQISPGVTR